MYRVYEDKSIQLNQSFWVFQYLSITLYRKYIASIVDHFSIKSDNFL